MSELKIKNCPFCGGEAKRFKEYGDERNGYADFVGYRCVGCYVSKGARGDTSKPGYADNSKIEKRAIENWNHRAQPEANADAKDARRWRMFMKALHTYLPGPGHGVRIKIVEICPMYGEETEVDNLEKLLDAAIAHQSTPKTDAPQAKGSEVDNG